MSKRFLQKDTYVGADEAQIPPATKKRRAGSGSIKQQLSVQTPIKSSKPNLWLLLLSCGYIRNYLTTRNVRQSC